MSHAISAKIMSASAYTPAPCRLVRDEFDLWIDEVFPSDVSILTEASRRILSEVESQTQRDDLDRVELALDEALANAIIHGNQGDTSKAVRIGVALKKDASLLIIVKDVGSGFDITRLPEPTAKENLLMNHGRGIFLIKQLADDVWFRFESGTEICMQFGPPLRMKTIRKESEERSVKKDEREEKCSARRPDGPITREPPGIGE